MLTVPENAGSRPSAPRQRAPAIEIPAGTGVTGPGFVMTGFPHTPEGAIGQLAQIDIAVLQSMSLQTAHEVYNTWALPGGVSAEDWWITASVRAFLSSTGMGEVKDPSASVTLEPAAALVKGTDGPDWAAVCVLMKVSAPTSPKAQIGSRTASACSGSAAAGWSPPAHRRPPHPPPGPAPRFGRSRPAGDLDDLGRHQPSRTGTDMGPGLPPSAVSHRHGDRAGCHRRPRPLARRPRPSHHRRHTARLHARRPGAQISAATSGMRRGRRESPRTSPEERWSLPAGSRPGQWATRPGSPPTWAPWPADRGRQGPDRVRLRPGRHRAGPMPTPGEHGLRGAGRDCRRRVRCRVPANVPTDGDAPAPASYAVTPVAYPSRSSAPTTTRSRCSPTSPSRPPTGRPRTASMPAPSSSSGSAPRRGRLEAHSGQQRRHPQGPRRRPPQTRRTRQPRRSSPRAGSSSTRSSREHPGSALRPSLLWPCSPGCSSLRS